MHAIAALAVWLGLLVAGCGGDKSPVAPVAGEDESSPDTSGWDISQIVPLDSVRAMAAGTRMYVRTEFDHRGMRDLAVDLVAVVDDFVPPMPVIMFQVADSAFAQIGGAAFGMSGSPVFCAQGIVGALSMGPGEQAREPYYFMATPIEWMLSSALPALPARAKPAAIRGQSMAPLGISLAVSGLAPHVRERYARALPAQTLWTAGGLASAGSGVVQSEFVPGSPLAAAVVFGDEITVAGVGTVTYVDGNRFVGFGHPFFGVGPVALPVVGARILAEITWLGGPYKLFTLDPAARGALTLDRIPGVGGTLGEEVPLVPLTLTATMPDGSTLSLSHWLAHRGAPREEQAFYAAMALYGPVANRLDNELGKSVRTRLKMKFADYEQSVDQSRLYADPKDRIHGLLWGAEADFSDAFWSLVNHRDYSLELESVELAVSIVDSALYAAIDTVIADSVAVAGSEFTVTARLRLADRTMGEVVFHEVLPDTLTPGRYALEALPASEVLGDEDAVGGDSFGLGSFFGPPPPEEGDLASLFERFNREDEKTVLAMKLELWEPAPPDSVVGPDYGVGSDLYGDAPPFPGFSDQEEGAGSALIKKQSVGLVLSGTARMYVQISAP